MSCDSCEQVEQCINCPEAPTGVAGAKLYDVFYQKAANNIGSPNYTVVLYTNNTSNNKYVLIESNCSIDTVANPHSVITDYLNDGVSVGTSNPKTSYLQTRSDLTHFLTTTTVAPGKSISLKFTSDDATAVLNWIVSIIYVY